MNTEHSILPNPVIPPDMPTSEIIGAAGSTVETAFRQPLAYVRQFARSPWFQIVGGIASVAVLAALALPMWKAHEKPGLGRRLMASLR